MSTCAEQRQHPARSPPPAAGDLRILVQGSSRWWWLVTATPTYGQLVAEWAAGLVVAAGTGLGPLLRMAAGADYLGVVRVDGHFAGPSPSLIAGVFLAIAITIRAGRRATR